MSRWTCVMSMSVILLLVSGQQKDEESCASQQTCKYCIRMPQCVWCSKPDSGTSDVPLVRCGDRNTSISAGKEWCPDSQLVNDENEMWLLENRELSSARGRTPVQVQPQRVRLRLRQGEKHRLTMRYSQAEGYPVDLYYLMDLSHSMKRYRDDLANLGLQLAAAMQNLTSKFRLGFGSFIDKVTLPMSRQEPRHVKNPCLQLKTRCDPSYGYKNQLSLTEDISLFKTRVQRAQLSANLDIPEGGFDGLMQAMVCTEEIRWRPDARHLIVFSTDGPSHLAGDGRVAGIIQPNDEQCHLDETGTYTHSLLQDYPSVSQISRKAREHNVNIIFAVVPYQKETYEILSSVIGGTSVAVLDKHSTNVVEFVREEYAKIVSRVTLTDDASRYIDVKYFSRCLRESDDLLERRDCDGIHERDIVEFEIDVKALDCPKNPREWKQTFEIKPLGVNESLIIDVELICDCPCDRKGHRDNQPGSKYCNGNGTMTCGICSCDKGFYGKRCDCEGGIETLNDTESCRPDNTTEVCNGRGICGCGVCVCAKRENPHELIYGKYCECDNFSCKRSGGQICGGNGNCKCGKCNCWSGWGGETCNCKHDTAMCKPPGFDTEICSGHGECRCGECHCNTVDNVRYSGLFCEECPTCLGKRCERIKDCVECRAYKTGPLANDCGNCSFIDISLVDKIESNPVLDQETEAHVCHAPSSNDSTFVFRYEYGKGGDGDIKVIKVTAQKEKIYPVPVNVAAVGLWIVGSTIILGLLSLIIWKIVTTIQDKREFAKFEKERAEAKWGRVDNPIYKKATSNFTNPTFGKSSKPSTSVEEH